MIGLVFPIYATTFPDEVRMFVEQLSCRSDAYIFAVSSRKCRPQVFDSLNSLLQARGAALSAARSISMPQNYIPVFTVEPEESIQQKDMELVRMLDEFAPVILTKTPSIEEAKELSGLVAFPILDCSLLVILKQRNALLQSGEPVLFDRVLHALRHMRKGVFGGAN